VKTPHRHHQKVLVTPHALDRRSPQYSRLEQQDLPRTPLQRVEMIHSLLVDQQSSSPASHLRSELISLVDLYGEPVSIRQALVNLLDNALKSLAIPSSNYQHRGQQTPTERILWIQDNGIGFDADQKEKLFGLFERLHNAQEYEGTGVGWPS